ncbi:hypothetical protein [Tianweitania sediminis]|uniref:Uncharacterized protein n=1 Tax=Tianweitania sediminis TaxID=1502156 RepID=A0A8J7R2L6_9HYPH|nr:hypothetical protein [Tianweitania sediminis]MBP0440447.1 hypothetical protein [Tianweitania sediminis]
MRHVVHQRLQIADAIEKCDWSGCPIGNKEILKAAVIALRSFPVHADLATDLDEVRKEVFGDVGDEPNVFADYDRACELSGKLQNAISILRGDGNA